MNESRQSRQAQLVALARAVLEQDDRVEHWLTHPQPGLGNRRPIDVAHDEAGYRTVENLLLRLEYGVYS
jgi:putative toxin-antitoxin system antitoxin component (TIGR02293 family)